MAVITQFVEDMLSRNEQYEGKAKFQRYQRAIHFLVAVFQYIPRPVCLSLWSVSDLSHGNFGRLIRYCVLKKLAHKCGDRVFVGRGVEIRNWQSLELGSRVSIHQCCYIEARGGVVIGDDVSIAHQSSIVSTQHTWEDLTKSIRDNPVTLEKITIENDVWIGCGCRILAGVEICSRSVVAAGSVVTRSVPCPQVVAGVPARMVRQLPESSQKRTK
jgi:acetyltransferase-like isoleucine patch superfamily enzyme